MGDMREDRTSHMRRMQRWRFWDESRDEIIMDAIAAGITPTIIHRRMGVSRAHIYRLLGKEHQQCQKTA